MTPFDSALSKVISNITEVLYGHNVKPGESPIDQLIAAVEAKYLDWDIDDPKFQALVTKFLGKMPTMAEWRKLFEQSQQSIEMKSDLLHRIRRKTPKAQSDEPLPTQAAQGYQVIPVTTHDEFLKAVGKERYAWDLKDKSIFDQYQKTGNIYIIKKDGKLYAAAFVNHTAGPGGLVVADVDDNPIVLPLPMARSGGNYNVASPELQKILDNLT